MADITSLIMDVHPGDGLTLDGRIHIHLVHKSGRVARLKVTAPRDVAIEKDNKEIAAAYLASQDSS